MRYLLSQRTTLMAAFSLGICVLVTLIAWLLLLRMPQTGLARMAIGFDGHSIRADVQVATQPQDVARGLMFTERLDPDEGMLLVFDGDDTKRCVWMKNTPIPLSIAFVNAQGLIREIVEASANSRVVLCVESVSKVLEMRAGWFHQAGIGVGDRLMSVSQ
jgi:uncharacterized protein